jgi:hypothetical protein
MLPLTLLATKKLLNLLTANDALSQVISTSAVAAGANPAVLTSSQIFASYATPDMGDLDLQLTYPRVCIYAARSVNSQREKFRRFSGTVSLEADVWASASLEQVTELALHFYVEGVASLLRSNVGDWGDGIRYSGIYEVRMQTPKAGGVGFVQSAKVMFNVEASFN